jgi:ketosteroid isomerase-like protein
MSIIDRFEAFASEFEAAVQDDDWSRLEKYLAEDATYLNVGGPDPKSVGCQAVLAYLQADVSAVDRHFDHRDLVALTPPVAEGNRLARRWRCTYRLTGAPDLVVEGEARYLFEGDLIKEIEEEPTADSFQRLAQWMKQYSGLLQTKSDQTP